MRVCVYVEGPSDQYALEALLAPLLERMHQRGVAVNFFQSPEGDRKKTLLTKVPVKAANALLNDPESVVVVVPDLYPMNRGFPHGTFDELRAGVLGCFRRALADKGAADDARLEDRFHVFCFKHDMEALVLACTESLARRLGCRSLAPTWALPVEDQDQGKPPKRVVEELFHHHGKRYRDTADAPVILRGQAYTAIANACPQCFKPFVDWLESL